MKVVLLFVAIWLNCSAASSSNQVVTTVAIPIESNWVIGMTLDEFFESGKPTPFTQQSLADFETSFSTATIEEFGQFNMMSDIVSNQDDKMEAFGIKSSLSSSFMGYTVDAHMDFARKSVSSDSDVSFIMRASSTGRRKQLAMSEYNKLELRDSAKTEVLLDSFLRTYGDYVIVGFIYGGEILFEATNTARSLEDKMDVEAGMGMSFGAAGFEIEADIDMTHNKSAIQKAIDSKTEWSIRPNTLENADTDELITAMTSLAMGGMKDDDTLYATLSQKAKSVLAGESLDPITAVVVPVSSLMTVHDHFKNVDDPLQDTAGFYEFLNEVYIEELSLSKQLDMVRDQWSRMLAKYQSLSEMHPFPTQLIGDWEHRFTLLRNQLLKLNTVEDIITASEEYQLVLPGKDWNADFMTTDSFYEITARGMKQQFQTAVMDLYEDMLQAAPTPYPTSFPTPPPVGPINLVHKGDTSNLGECEGHCDWYEDCKGELECFYRYVGFEALPPGCIGNAHNVDTNYCYDPNDRISTVNKGWDASNGWGDLDECEGDCDYDWDCRGNLKCYLRHATSTWLPPGCKGSAYDGELDFCYDPSKHGQNAKPADSAKAPVFGHNVLKGLKGAPSGSLNLDGQNYPKSYGNNDGFGNGDYVFTLNYSSLWLVAVAVCSVITAVTAFLMCKKSSRRKVVYRKVQVMDSDSELESKRLKEIRRV